MTRIQSLTAQEKGRASLRYNSQACSCRTRRGRLLDTNTNNVSQQQQKKQKGATGGQQGQDGPWQCASSATKPLLALHPSIMSMSPSRPADLARRLYSWINLTRGGVRALPAPGSGRRGHLPAVVVPHQALQKKLPVSPATPKGSRRSATHQRQP